MDRNSNDHLRGFTIRLGLAFLLGLGITSGLGQSAKGTWDSEFRLPPGLNGSVYAIASMGDDLLVGGAFTKAGNIAANGVAKWDGTNWTAFGTGVNGWVLALAVSGTNIYAGGQFQSAGGTAATNIAKWNGSNWEPLGGGVDRAYYTSSRVISLYATGKDLYVGGNFEIAGGIPAFNIARWDGSAWHPMDKGAYLPDDPEPWGTVDAITGDGTNVYVGGVFIQVGSMAATNLARWNGTAWDSIGDCNGGQATYTYQGNTLFGSVIALVMHEGALFAGGNFGLAGGVPAEGIARWDGVAWENVGDIPGMVTALESYSGSLYVAGDFTDAGGISATNAAVWIDGSWAAVDAGTHDDEFIATIAHTGSQLYLGGTFTWMQGISAGNIARRWGGGWESLGTGTGNSLGGEVFAVTTDGSNIYAAGYFGTAGTNGVSGLAKWDGTNWFSVGSPSAITGSGIVYPNSLAVVGTNVYLAGYPNLACWNGSIWSSPGGPLTNISVSQLLSVNNELFLSGGFVDSSGNGFGPLAAWNGANWSNVPLNFTIYDKLATDQTNLYLTETFDRVDTNYNDHFSVQVEEWDGTNLVYLGDPIPDLLPSALAVRGTNVYLAGPMTAYYEAPALYWWNGTSWQTVGAPIADSGFIATILPVRENVYVAGSFRSVNGMPANNIAQWTGARWLSLDTGVGGESPGDGGTIEGMVALGRSVFVGGQFARAGAADSGNFAIWNEAPEIRLGIPQTDPSGIFNFDVHGLLGDQLEIQASGNLADWTPIGTMTLQSDVQAFSDTRAANTTNQFYRARFIK